MFPTEIRANFSTTITIEDAASLVLTGFTPYLILGGAASLKLAGATVGADIVFTLTPALTIALVTGQYWYQIVSENAGATSRLFIASGSTLILGAISGSGAYDGRSTAELILDAIDATIRGKATADQQSYVIQSGAGSRSLSRMTMEDLLLARRLYAGIVNSEKRARTQAPLFKRHTFGFVEVD